MKKLLALSVIGTSLLLISNSAKADWDYWGVERIESAGINTGSNEFYKEIVGTKIYTINSTTGEYLLRSNSCNGGFTFDNLDNQWECTNNGDNSKDYTIEDGSLIINTFGNSYKKFNIKDFTYGTKNESGNILNSFQKTHKRNNVYQDENGNKIVEVNGSKILEKRSNGELHIGENSLVTRELNGRQQLYATDANGNKIPIDVTNGSKLLIKGRDVEQSINNIGALSAALTGLPTVPTNTTLACGLGTGTHGGDFAFSGGCASKVNERLSINYAASITVPGQDYAGDFKDKYSARAGFVWKLGKSVQPNLIGMKAKEKMEAKINALEEKNTNLENTVSTLMAKLEHLEKISLGESKSKDLATIELP